jgi:hypothetical protein
VIQLFPEQDATNRNELFLAILCIVFLVGGCSNAENVGEAGNTKIIFSRIITTQTSGPVGQDVQTHVERTLADGERSGTIIADSDNYNFKGVKKFSDGSQASYESNSFYPRENGAL